MSAEFPNDIRDLMDRLDRALPPHTRASGAADGDPLVEAARRLAEGPDFPLSNAALDRIEARLRQRTAELPRPVQRPAVRPVRRNLWGVLRYAAAACLIVVLALGGVTGASASSLPGDTLYPVKRTVEDVRLALVTEGNEPGLRVNLADRRLDEFETLLDDRQKVYPKSLEEASDQMTRALDLLSSGHGNRTQIVPRIATLTHRQAALILRAAPQAGFKEWKRLQALAGENATLQLRLASEGSVPDFVPDTTPTPTATPSPVPSSTATPVAAPETTFTATPSSTPSATPTRTPTRTPSVSPTATMSATPTRTPSASPTATPSAMVTRTPTYFPLIVSTPVVTEAAILEEPSRTPPGHGPTPGLGDNPPGHGGDNPGQGKDKDKK